MIHNIQKSASETHFDKNISGMNTDNVQGAIDELKGTIGYISKNLLDNIYPTQTISGVTFTVNSDKSVTVNGTASDTAMFLIGPTTLDAGLYILNGCPQNGSTEKYAIWASVAGDNHFDVGYDYPFEVKDKVAFNTRIVIYKGFTANNLTFYPMIRPASIKDNTYEPYVASVKSLICNIEKISINQSFTSSTSGSMVWSYKATRRCLINVSLTVANYSGKPLEAKAYKTGVENPIVHHRNTADEQSHLCIPMTVCLERGEQITVYSIYNNATLNRVIVEGYVQYLE